MYKADRMYQEMMALDQQIKALQPDGDETVTEYFRLYTLLIYNYAWLGSLYDIYDPDAVILLGNGRQLHGAAEMAQNTTQLLAAFPDLHLTLADIFVTPRDNGYQLYRRFYLDGTNLGFSPYGAPTGKPLEGRKALCQSMSTLERKPDGWKITREFTMYPEEWLQQVCAP